MATVIYARKSTESEDRQVQSLADQLRALQNLAAREGLTVSEEIVESKSAKTPGARPEFQRLVERIQAGQVTGILTWQINRLSRNMVDGGLISHLLQTGKLHFIRTPERTYLPQDSALLLAIETGMATSFVQDLSRNVKRGMDSKADKGWKPSRAPFGYLNDRNTKQIIPDPQRFALLKQGFELLASGGHTVAAVRRELIKRGLTGLDGTSNITSSLFYSVFTKPFYCGKFLYGGEWKVGKHEPMVNEEVFDKVQRALGRKLKVREPEIVRPYAGIFICPNCGCQITAETKTKTYKTTGQTRSYTYYRCSGFKGCPKTSVTEYQLDRVITRLCDSLKIPDKYLEWARMELLRQQTSESSALLASRNALSHQIGNLNSRLKRLREMRLDDEIGADEYKSEKVRLVEELASAERKQADQESLVGAVNRGITEKLDQLEKIKGFEEMSATAKRSLIRSIAGKCFLTLERVSFEVDEVIHRIATFEPAVSGFQSGENGNLELSFAGWQPFVELIRTLESNAVMAEPGLSRSILMEFSVNAPSSTLSSENQNC